MLKNINHPMVHKLLHIKKSQYLGRKQQKLQIEIEIEVSFEKKRKILKIDNFLEHKQILIAQNI